MSSAPGRLMPAIATTAPSVPRRRSPSSMARFTAFNPGSVWLMVNSSMNVSSSVHRRLTTMLLRKWAITPPPKLVAPMRRKAPKSCSAVSFCADSFVAVDGMALQAVHEPGFGRAERDPSLGVALQSDEEILHELLRLGGHLVARVELHLKGVFADDGLVVAARTPDRDVRLGEKPLAEVELAERKQQFFDNPLVDEPDRLAARRGQPADCRKHA